MAQTFPSLLPLKDFADKHPGFTESRLRWLFWRSRAVSRTVQGGKGERRVKELEPNGFEPCFCRVGKRIFVDEGKFFECVDRANGRGEDSAG